MSGPAERGPVRVVARFLEIQTLGLNLPFAVAFLVVAAGGLPPVVVLGLAVVAFVGARNAGHSFNRWVDRADDRRNPRTGGRALVTGRLSGRFALAVTAGSAGLLVAAAALLNPLALGLSPVALALVLGYSATKRWGWGTTLFLGLVEAITPAGAFVAVQGALPPPALLAVVGMFLWGTAFETIHSLGDLASDRALGLPSLPARFGAARARGAVSGFHALALVAFGGFGLLAGLRAPFFLGLAGMAGLVALTDRSLRAAPDRTALPFRRHSLLALLFLLGTLAAVFAPIGPAL